MINALLFLVQTFASLFCAVLFLRAWIFWRRIPAFNPYCRFIYELSDFIIVPLRKVMPSTQNVDIPSLFTAFIVCLLQAFLTSLLLFNFNLIATFVDILLLPFSAVLLFADHLLSTVFWLSILYAILSWVSSSSPFFNLLHMLIDPLLASIRRRLPQSLKTAPIDLSLLFFIIVLIALDILIKGWAH